jgi:hypothetical protein
MKKRENKNTRSNINEVTTASMGYYRARLSSEYKHQKKINVSDTITDIEDLSLEMVTIHIQNRRQIL